MLNFPTLHQARLAASIALAVLLAVGLTPGASAQIAFEDVTIAAGYAARVQP